MTFSRAALNLLCVFAAATPGALADVKLPALFSDHMVLQQDTGAPVWGWAAAGEKVTVNIAGQTQTTVAGPDGTWKVTLPKLPEGGKPQTLTVAGKNTLTIQDVLVGEVWVCSGQSNMQFRLKNARNGEQEVAQANDSEIRLFNIPTSPAMEPASDVKAKWVVCSPAEIPMFSAVGYFFGRELRHALHRPVGLIDTSVGGTPAEAWTSREGLAKDPKLDAMAEGQIGKLVHFPEVTKHFAAKIAAWESKYGGDTGAKGEANGWADPGCDDHSWATAKLPATYAQLGIKTGGSVWFRKTIDLPASAANQPFTIATGYGVDLKRAYFNGVELQRAGNVVKPPFYYQGYTFEIPAKLMREGKNVIAIRVYSHTEQGGIAQPANQMGPLAEVPGLDMSQWRYQVETAGPALTAEARAKLPNDPFPIPIQTAAQLFNGMVNPLIPYAVRGVVWYQGESNAGRGDQYRSLLPALIADWRARWGDLPFYLVQLANFEPAPAQPGPSTWAEIREAQSLTAATVAHTAMAVTIDIGEADNIHPKNKQEVGRRLSLAALANTYGWALEYSGPLYQSMAVEGNAIRLKFTHAGGLQAKGGPLRQFAIAGDDQKFVWADAKIDAGSVVVSSPAVTRPAAVRYAWANNPEGCNLYNGAGLPASPFRTDTWPGKPQ